MILMSLPQFGIGANSKLKLRCPNLSFCPNSELGKILSWGTRVKSFLNRGTSVTNIRFAPIPHWGNIQLGAPVNFGFAPIPNWGNIQLGHQRLQLQTCPNSGLGQCSTWGTSDFNFGFAPIPNWG